MTDTQILLQAFLGSDLAQAVTAELGEGVIGMAYMQGQIDNHQMILNAGDGIDHLQLIKDQEDAVDGLFIGLDEEVIWEPVDEDFEV